MLLTNLPSLNQFWRILRNHDWTYQYSDDHSVWSRGHTELCSIHNIVKEGGDEYNKLFDDYKKYAFREDSSIQEPERPAPTKQQQEQEKKDFCQLCSSLKDACDNLWNVESNQIFHSNQLWQIVNPLSSMLSKVRDIIEEKSKSQNWNTSAYKGYRHIKEYLEQN
jgi:hypothetical protein